MTHEIDPAAARHNSGAHPTALRNALIDIGPRAAVAAGLPANWCIAASGMTREFYSDFGFEGVRALGVRVSAYNPAGWEHWLNNVPPSEWPDEAWSVGRPAAGA